jgi:hypothetical protein
MSVKLNIRFLIFVTTFFIFSSCKKDDDSNSNGDIIQLITAQFEGVSLFGVEPVVPVGDNLVLGFSTSINPDDNTEISLADEANNLISLTYENLDNNKIISITTSSQLPEGERYSLSISNNLSGELGEQFAGVELSFEIEKGELELISVSINGNELNPNSPNIDIPLIPQFNLVFSHELSESILLDNLALVGNVNYDFTISKTDEFNYILTPTEELADLSKINLLFPSSLGEDIDRSFETVSYTLYTEVSTVPDFPIISDEELMTLVQAQTFKYFWDFGHPVSGLARERNSSGDVVTSGGSGFGLMAMIVGVERGFITRSEAIDRWEKIFNFLENADRFHGAWSHWLNGSTGTVIPFSQKDNGGDLVETAFLVQGMLTVRQYLDPNIPQEADLIAQINMLWEGVEWDWYTRDGQNVLFWHWSPNYGWDMNLRIRGHNETQIIYTLAAASPTHGIDPIVYHEGYANSGGMQNGGTYYNYFLPLGENRGGPLFFAHYSYLGMDPRNLEDQYANYWQQNVNHTQINRAYCIANPINYVGYSDDCWGLTASDNNTGYSAHSPNNDLGVITPTAALSSMPYTPTESLDALKHFYYYLGDRLWGNYGFYDAFNPTAGWVANSYLAIDQGPIIIMIENYRTGLLWDLYMSSPEVQSGLDDLGFTY